MRNVFLGRATLAAALLVVLLIVGFGSLLLIVPTAKEGIVAELKATDKPNEFVCEFPPVIKRAPPSFGFISWRYTVRANYDFGADSPGIHSWFQANPPPPTSMMMIPMGGVPAGATKIHFESAEGILEPYVLNVCLWPLTRKWTFKFPQELPKPKPTVPSPK